VTESIDDLDSSTTGRRPRCPVARVRSCFVRSSSSVFPFFRSPVERVRGPSDVCAMMPYRAVRIQRLRPKHIGFVDSSRIRTMLLYSAATVVAAAAAAAAFEPMLLRWSPTDRFPRRQMPLSTGGATIRGTHPPNHPPTNPSSVDRTCERARPQSARGLRSPQWLDRTTKQCSRQPTHTTNRVSQWQRALM